VPYDGDDDLEVIRKLMADELPPPAEGVPEPVQEVLDKCLVLDPAQRFPTAMAMQRALEKAMVALGEVKTTDDVAAFIRSTCPELTVSRKDLIGKAIEDARAREVAGGARDEDALAPTLVGDTEAVSRRARTSDVGTVQLVQRKPKPAPAIPETDSSVELDREPIVIPKRSLAWLWITLLLVAGTGGAALRYPAVAHRALGALGLGSSETSRTDPAMPPPSSAPGLPSASVSATASDPRSQPTASASASAPMSASARAAASASASAAALHAARVPPAHGGPVPAEPSAPEPTSSVPYSIYKVPPSPPTSSTPPTPSAAPSAATPASSGP
jgi:hypothetical protein